MTANKHDCEKRFVSTQYNPVYRSYRCTNTWYTHLHTDVLSCFVMVTLCVSYVAPQFAWSILEMWASKTHSVLHNSVLNDISACLLRPAETDFWTEERWAACQKLSEQRERPACGRTSGGGGGVMNHTYNQTHTECSRSITWEFCTDIWNCACRTYFLF